MKTFTKRDDAAWRDQGRIGRAGSTLNVCVCVCVGVCVRVRVLESDLTHSLLQKGGQQGRRVELRLTCPKIHPQWCVCVCVCVRVFPFTHHTSTAYDSQSAEHLPVDEAVNIQKMSAPLSVLDEED